MKAKGNVFPDCAAKACRENIGRVPIIPNLGDR
jgi:hypothetical protein